MRRPGSRFARLRRAGRWVARSVIVMMLVLSVVSAGWAVVRIANDPLLRPLAERSAAGFAAALDREMAQAATPQAVAERLTALLAQDPRNWIAIQAVEEVALARGIALPTEITAARAAAWDDDSGLLTVAGACLSCTVNAANCSLSEAMICNAPIALTPIGDVIGIGRAGVAAVTGAEVDRMDFALSAIGLGATVAVVATGGTSYTLKAGAGLIKMARKMNLLPPRLMALIADAARRGIRWDQVATWNGITDPARLIVPEVVAPLAATAADLGRLDDTLGATKTLHLLRHVDGPDDARRLANAAETLGPRTLGTLEILGKSRFMRAALRLGDEAAALMAGIIGALLTLATALASAMQGWLTRRLRRALHHAAR